MLVVGGHAAAVIPRLEGAVGDQNGHVRLAAIGALGILGQAAAPSAARLSTLLKNEQAPFAERMASATSLAQIVPEESDDAWAFVVTNLDSRIVPWRVRALQSLPVFGDRVASIRPKLLDFSTDSNDAVRAAAKLVLNGLPKD